ncbi:transcriptional regulator, CarD family [Hathewaya proteolytica DSM 3090]|uniref:Transcriptional regulator, CarD family n=1 Tax=Hathewaya proteolytica DSM 3090 TaxID=1121331 RepID=A0A1M6JF07_9CLOT|nr:CarD family transcriptional regulator [Hathewaya proteolytica]SHJ45202.1 transcriptional regulator, CarD family [Hathewaya proteolytica DSM 3090]
MFSKGDYIVYGNSGVCKVENVGPMSSNSSMKERVYYTLMPYYSKNTKIFTPIDNEKIIMRRVMSKEKAVQLIDDMKNIDSLWIQDERKREQEYKEAFKKCDCRELVKIIKSIYTRKASRMAEGKKVTSGDEKYFQLAEESLYDELAISLGIDREDVKDYVLTRADSIFEEDEQ